MAKTWQIVLATIGIFFAGLIAGGATTIGVLRWVSLHRPHMLPPGMGFFGPRSGGPGGPGGPYRSELMRGLADRLDLTPSQREQVTPIIERTSSQLARARHSVQAESILAIEKMQDEIAVILTPEQKVKFGEIVAEQRARMQRFKAMQQQQPK